MSGSNQPPTPTGGFQGWTPPQGQPAVNEHGAALPSMAPPRMAPPPLAATAGPYSKNSGMPYGQGTVGNAPRDPHRRPARILVVAILCFIFAVNMALSSVGTAGSNAMTSFMNTSQGSTDQIPVPPNPVMGIDAPSWLGVGYYLAIAAMAGIAGIALLKRKYVGAWLLLVCCIIVTVNGVLSIPVYGPWIEEYAQYTQTTMERDFKAQNAAAPDMKETIKMALKGVFIGMVVLFAIIQAVLIGLTFSVKRWFKGEAVFPVEA